MTKCPSCEGMGAHPVTAEPCVECKTQGFIYEPTELAVVADQPEPIKNEGPCIQDLVIADIEARKAVGLERYGTLLQPFNGRDALMDAYAEALDLCQYLRQAIEERNAKTAGAVPPGDSTV